LTIPSPSEQSLHLQCGGLPTVFVVVLSWNQCALTVECVLSLLEVNYPRCRIIVVDNASSDETVETLRARFGERIDLIVNRDNLGFAAGCNVGIRRALAQEADCVLLLNNDTVVNRRFLTPMVEALDAHPDAAAIVPKIYLMSRPDVLWAAGGQIRPWRGRATGRGLGCPDTGQYDSAGWVDYGSGCCLLMPRPAIARVGLLNESYFAYFEDVDWCLRARASGMRVWYAPGSKIWHVAGAASGGSAQQGLNGRTSTTHPYLAARNNLWFIRKYIGGFPLPVALLSFGHYVVYNTLVCTRLRRWRRLACLWRGALDGALTNPGQPERIDAPAPA
jgi:hypothetical protein